MFSCYLKKKKYREKKGEQEKGNANQRRMNNELLNLKITNDCIKDYIRSIIFKNKGSAGDLNQKIEANN